jgi:hypothetical protein
MHIWHAGLPIYFRKFPHLPESQLTLKSLVPGDDLLAFAMERTVGDYKFLDDTKGDHLGTENMH